MSPEARRFLRSAQAGLVLAAMLLACACSRQPAPASSAHSPSAQNPPSPASPPAAAPQWVAAARRQIGITVRYDPAYVRIAYPGGDVPADRGVCTDVVIRAFRTQGLDLQQRVHEDMRANFAAYPRQWGLRAPDANIDHRRVPNLQRWFERQHWAVDVSDDASAYRAGDLVTWDLGDNVPHIGIVSERHWFGRPLIIHNIGSGTREDNILFSYRITGHYRPRSQLQGAATGLQ